MPEEESFAVFVKLMQDYKMRDMFKPTMAELGLCMFQLENLVQVLLLLYKKFEFFFVFYITIRAMILEYFAILNTMLVRVLLNFRQHVEVLSHSYLNILNVSKTYFRNKKHRNI